jgi:hypothetical protein
MPLSRFLAKSMLETDQIERLNQAYIFALRSPDLVDRNDPIVDIVARKIIEVAVTTGSRDPREICDTALRQLGLEPAGKRGPPLAGI